jgi:hypothetical protein
MRELALLGKAMRQAARRAEGTNPRLERGNVAQARGAGLESAMLPLPVDVSKLGDLQDPTTGQMLFLLDYSSLDGPDPLA